MVSVNLNRLSSITSACQKPGPENALRGRSPNVPGAGVANAAGLMKFRSLFRNGSAPAIKSGRRMLRQLSPPGVLTTATNRAGSEGKLEPNEGTSATKPFANVPPAPLGQPAVN